MAKEIMCPNLRQFTHNAQDLRKKNPQCPSQKSGQINKGGKTTKKVGKTTHTWGQDNTSGQDNTRKWAGQHTEWAGRHRNLALTPNPYIFI